MGVCCWLLVGVRCVGGRGGAGEGKFLSAFSSSVHHGL